MDQLIDPDFDIQEFAQRMTDPMWRISNLYTIVDKTGKKLPFRPNEPQQDFLERMHTRNVILKARQRGFTTLCCIIYLDDCLFNDDIRAAVIAHKLDDSEVIFRDKVRNVYMDLPNAIKDRKRLVKDSATTLGFDNGSTIRVSTSTRSGTVQWLHVSEYGKICSIYPDKAREIRTGAFPSAEQGTITIESTAEGNSGDFYEKCTAAEQLQDTLNEERQLSRLDYKFFFYSWIGAPEYTIKQSVVPESREDTKYFDNLEVEVNRTIDQPHRNWYLVQERDLMGDMKREYPATPKEAFEQAIEGAYFADQLALAKKFGRIGSFPIDPAYPVNTAWDLGRNDFNTIWLWQDIDALSRFVGYYQNTGEWIAHYIDWLNEWKEEHEIQFGVHYMPHDGDIKTLWVPGGSMEVMGNLGFYPEIVQRSSNKQETINAARRKFSSMAFDEVGCKEGLDLLKKYRKEWDEKHQIYRNVPVHDESSHCADGLMTFTSSGHVPLSAFRTKPETHTKYKKLTSRAGRRRRALPYSSMGV